MDDKAKLPIRQSLNFVKAIADKLCDFGVVEERLGPGIEPGDF
jgi:hypothetical protein